MSTKESKPVPVPATMPDLVTAIWEHSRKGVALIAAIVATVSIIASAGAAWAVNGAKLDNHESRIKKLEDEHSTDHDLLVEVRADVKWLVRQVKGGQ